MAVFSDYQISVLRGSFSAIGRSVKSSRSQTGHISQVYVQQVLTGKVTRDNDTTRLIKEKASQILEALSL